MSNPKAVPPLTIPSSLPALTSRSSLIPPPLPLSRVDVSEVVVRSSPLDDDLYHTPIAASLFPPVSPLDSPVYDDIFDSPVLESSFVAPLPDDFTVLFDKFPLPEGFVPASVNYSSFAPFFPPFHAYQSSSTRIRLLLSGTVYDSKALEVVLDSEDDAWPEVMLPDEFPNTVYCPLAFLNYLMGGPTLKEVLAPIITSIIRTRPGFAISIFFPAEMPYSAIEHFCYEEK